MKLCRLHSWRRGFPVALLCVILISNGIAPVRVVYGQERPAVGQPTVGAGALPVGTAGFPSPDIRLSPGLALTPPLLKGVKVYPDDPFRVDFILDKGDTGGSAERLKTETTRLVKYFLASLAIPEKDLWVNLSPYEKERIIPDNFGKTEMGRDLLQVDYILKQVTASLFDPGRESGRAFWQKVYRAAAQRYGTTDIPLDTFNKVWIVPDEARIHEEGSAVILVKSHLKVMLESDYLALKNGADTQRKGQAGDIGRLSRDAARDVIVSVLETEVNEGANFAVLRQITDALILATWYKTALKEQLLNRGYTDRSRVKGVDQDPANNAAIYQAYIGAFRQGAFNFIKEDYDPLLQEMVPRKYFSGGYTTMLNVDGAMVPLSRRLKRVGHGSVDFSQRSRIVAVRFDPAAKGPALRMSFGRVDFAGQAAYSYLLGVFSPGHRGSGKVDRAQARAFDADYLNKILKENAKYYGIEWNGDGQELLEGIFYRYKIGRDRSNLRDEFSRLSGLWDALDTMPVRRSFEAVSGWMINQFRELSGKPERERELAVLTITATRFAQVVFSDFVKYSRGSRSMVNLLRKEGWNCQSISDLTAVLMGLWGARGVSVVSVQESPQGEKYPLPDGTGHVVNLVRVGKIVAYLDQGNDPVYFEGRVKIINEQGRPEGVRLSNLSDRPVEGFTIKHIFKSLEIKNAFNHLLTRFKGLEGMLVSSQSFGGQVTIGNSGVLIKLLPQSLKDLEEWSADVLWMESRFEDNVMKTRKIMLALFEEAKKVEQIKPLLERSVKTGLLTVKEAGYFYKLTIETAPFYIEHLPGILDGFKNVVGNVYARQIESLLERALSEARVIVRAREFVDEYARCVKEKNASALPALSEKIFNFVREQNGTLRIFPNLFKRLRSLYYAVGGTKDFGQAVSDPPDKADYGGVDLDPRHFNLVVDGRRGVPFPRAGENQEVSDLEGLVPRILSVRSFDDFFKSPGLAVRQR